MTIIFLFIRDHSLNQNYLALHRIQTIPRIKVRRIHHAVFISNGHIQEQIAAFFCFQQTRRDVFLDAILGCVGPRHLHFGTVIQIMVIADSTIGAKSASCTRSKQFNSVWSVLI